MLYLYPTTITDALLDAMAETPSVCRYIDLPLQHASDAVLRRMKRPGTQAGYARLLDRIRTRIPEVTLRTTFIVGFPGESEADIDALAGFIESQRFDHVGVFTYSHEEGTTAHHFIDDVPTDDKLRRQARLMTLQHDLVASRLRQRIGQRVRVLVDGPSEEHEWVVRGRLEGQAPEIDSIVYLTECDPGLVTSGTFIEAEIVDSRGYDLVARPQHVPAL
jgi:ribosomal protein S12 methylthiotransferase